MNDTKRMMEAAVFYSEGGEVLRYPSSWVLHELHQGLQECTSRPTLQMKQLIPKLDPLQHIEIAKL